MNAQTTAQPTAEQLKQEITREIEFLTWCMDEWNDNYAVEIQDLTNFLNSMEEEELTSEETEQLDTIARNQRFTTSIFGSQFDSVITDSLISKGYLTGFYGQWKLNLTPKSIQWMEENVQDFKSYYAMKKW